MLIRHCFRRPMIGWRKRLAWHLNCLVYSVAVAVRGKTTYKSQPCNHARKSDNQKGSKRQEHHISEKKAKGLRFRRLLAWVDVEIARQQNNNPMTKRQKVLRRKLRREFHSLNLIVLIRARERTLGKLRVWTLKSEDRLNTGNSRNKITFGIPKGNCG